MADTVTPVCINPLGLGDAWYTPETLAALAQSNWLYSAPDTAYGAFPTLLETLSLEAQANNLYVAPDTGYFNSLSIGNFALTQDAPANYLSGLPYTSPVGWFNGVNVSPNGPTATQDSKSPAGCYDMSGNVCQWVNDWYVDTYPNDPPPDPAGPESGTGRVLRGGGWSEAMQDCRTARRYSNTPTLAASNIGFQIAKSDASQTFFVEISASPGTIRSGETSTLTWTSSAVSACTITPGIGAVDPSGTITVSPATTTTYEITGYDEQGSNQCLASAIVTCYTDAIVHFQDQHLQDAVVQARGLTSGPVLLAVAPNLTSLDASNAGISDLTGLEQFTNLQTLDLSGNPFGNISPLASLHQLTSLNLSGCTNISLDETEWIDTFAALWRITDLTINDFPGIQDHVSLLAALPGLVHLTCQNGGIIDPTEQINDFTKFYPLLRLESLDLSHNNIADIPIPPPDDFLPNLQYLDLSYNKISSHCCPVVLEQDRCKSKRDI